MNETEVKKKILDEISQLFGDVPIAIKFDEDMYDTDLSYITSSL